MNLLWAIYFSSVLARVMIDRFGMFLKCSSNVMKVAFLSMTIEAMSMSKMGMGSPLLSRLCFNSASICELAFDVCSKMN